MRNHYSVIHHNLHFLKNLDKYINSAINDNIKLHDQINKKTNAIENTEEEKNRLLAQTGTLTEEQLESAYRSISEWWKGRRDAENDCEILRKKIEKHS